MTSIKLSRQQVPPDHVNSVLTHHSLQNVKMEVAHLKHEGREMDRQITKGEMDLKELVCADLCQIFAHIFFS